MDRFLIDSESGEKMSPMTMEFTKDGKLNYVFDMGTEMQNGFSAAYWTKDNYVYLKSESDEKEEKSKYKVDGDKLTITTGKVSNEFVKQENKKSNE